MPRAPLPIPKGGSGFPEKKPMGERGSEGPAGGLPGPSPLPEAEPELAKSRVPELTGQPRAAPSHHRLRVVFYLLLCCKIKQGSHSWCVEKPLPSIDWPCLPVSQERIRSNFPPIAHEKQILAGNMAPTPRQESSPSSQRKGPKWLTEGPLSPSSLLSHPSDKNLGNVSTTGAGFQEPPQGGGHRRHQPSGTFPSFTLFQPPNSPGYHTPSPSWGNRSSEGSSNLPKVTQLQWKRQDLNPNLCSAPQGEGSRLWSQNIRVQIPAPLPATHVA